MEALTEENSAGQIPMEQKTAECMKQCETAATVVAIQIVI